MQTISRIPREEIFRSDNFSGQVPVSFTVRARIGFAVADVTSATAAVRQAALIWVWTQGRQGGRSRRQCGQAMMPTRSCFMPPSLAQAAVVIAVRAGRSLQESRRKKNGSAANQFVAPFSAARNLRVSRLSQTRRGEFVGKNSGNAGATLIVLCPVERHLDVLASSRSWFHVRSHAAPRRGTPGRRDHGARRARPRRVCDVFADSPVEEVFPMQLETMSDR